MEHSTPIPVSTEVLREFKVHFNLITEEALIQQVEQILKEAVLGKSIAEKKVGFKSAISTEAAPEAEVKKRLEELGYLE